MYRILNRLEDNGFVTSSWEQAVRTGPKEYRVTPAGVELLHCWAEAIWRNRRYVDRFLARYQDMFSD